MKSLEKVLAQEPDSLTLEIIGPATVQPDKALLLYDVLVKRNPTIHLVTHARSCLIDAAVLLWLAGDERKMRDDSWMQMDSLERLEDTQPWDKIADSFQRVKKPMLMPPWIIDYRTVVRYINMYLPLEEVADRPLFHDELVELGLIESQEESQKLRELFQGSLSIKGS